MCVSKSFRAQDTLFLTGLVRDSDFPRPATKALSSHKVPESSLHVGRKVALGDHSPLSPSPRTVLFAMWLPPGLRGGERKRFLSEENLVSANTLGAHSL